MGWGICGIFIQITGHLRRLVQLGTICPKNYHRALFNVTSGEPSSPRCSLDNLIQQWCSYTSNDRTSYASAVASPTDPKVSIIHSTHIESI